MSGPETGPPRWMGACLSQGASPTCFQSTCTVLPVGRLITRPKAPLSLCSTSSSTVRTKLGSINCGEASNSWPSSDSIFESPKLNHVTGGLGRGEETGQFLFLPKANSAILLGMSAKPLRLFFCAGEPSGDLHAANLIQRLRERCPAMEAVGYRRPPNAC